MATKYKNKPIPKTVKLPYTLHKKLREKADKQRRSLHSLMILILEDSL